MLRKLNARSLQGSWGSTGETIAFGARAQGQLHVGTVVTVDGDFILNGATFDTDPCGAKGSSGCRTASMVRVLCQVLAVTHQSASVLIVTHDQPFATMVQGWINGSITTPPDWYTPVGSKASSFDKAIAEIHSRLGRIDIRLAGTDESHARIISLADGLADTVLSALIEEGRDRDWAITRTHELLIEGLSAN